MIIGTGIDMIEVERIAEKISKEAGFKELVFSKKEISYCESKTNKFEHYAARFAAKEAFLKALGTGWTSGVALNEIEILHNGNGQPQLSLLDETAKTLSNINNNKVLVSLSHLKAIASAVVIIQG